MIRLPRSAPVAHRVVQRLAVRGWRGSLKLWRLTERVAPLPNAAELTVFGEPFPVDLSEVIGPYLYFGVYERWELEILARVVRRGKACVDVGANDGLYTLAMRAAVGPDGMVVAFEPQPALAERLRRLVASREGADVFVLETALGASRATAPMTLFPGHSGLATLVAGGLDGGPTVEVTVERLDDIEIVRRLPEIEFLKVDVEAFESEVLAGAPEILASGRVRAALVEVSAAQADVAAALAQAGSVYRLFRVTQALRGGRYRARLEPLSLRQLAGATEAFNLFAARSEALAAVSDLILPDPR